MLSLRKKWNAVLQRQHQASNATSDSINSSSPQTMHLPLPDPQQKSGQASGSCSLKQYSMEVEMDNDIGAEGSASPCFSRSSNGSDSTVRQASIPAKPIAIKYYAPTNQEPQGLSQSVIISDYDYIHKQLARRYQMDSEEDNEASDMSRDSDDYHQGNAYFSEEDPNEDYCSNEENIEEELEYLNDLCNNFSDQDFCMSPPKSFNYLSKSLPAFMGSYLNQFPLHEAKHDESTDTGEETEQEDFVDETEEVEQEVLIDEGEETEQEDLIDEREKTEQQDPADNMEETDQQHPIDVRVETEQEHPIDVREETEQEYHIDVEEETEQHSPIAMDESTKQEEEIVDTGTKEEEHLANEEDEEMEANLNPEYDGGSVSSSSSTNTSFICISPSQLSPSERAQIDMLANDQRGEGSRVDNGECWRCVVDESYGEVEDDTIQQFIDRLYSQTTETRWEELHKDQRLVEQLKTRQFIHILMRKYAYPMKVTNLPPNARFREVQNFFHNCNVLYIRYIRPTQSAYVVYRCYEEMYRGMLDSAEKALQNKLNLVCQPGNFEELEKDCFNNLLKKGRKRFPSSKIRTKNRKRRHQGTYNSQCYLAQAPSLIFPATTSYVVYKPEDSQQLFDSQDIGYLCVDGRRKMKLNKIYNTSSQVILLFTIKKSRYYQGYAIMCSEALELNRLSKDEMVGIPFASSDDYRWKFACRVEWCSNKWIPMKRFGNYPNSLNNGRLLKYSKSVTLVNPALGKLAIDLLSDRIHTNQRA